jgi:hypothetical protein
MTPIRAAAVALLLLLAACGGDDDAPTVTPGAPVTSTSTSTSAGAAATVVSVTVRGGSVEGASRQRATLNQPVTIRVTSDVADQVHVHGYDKFFDVAAGRTGEVTFVANIPGVFEVEFERSHKVLFTLEVR